MLIDNQVTDLRDSRGRSYHMHEAILSVVMMFLLREGSRNSYNGDREEPRFSRNIRRMLGIRRMHGDAFNDVLVRVDTKDLLLPCRAGLASVWLENNNRGEHDKQDCELAAFKRLAAKLKELYPRLPILIVADALYANAPVIEACKASHWDFMLVIKDGVLKDLGEEIRLRPDTVKTDRPRGRLSYLRDLEYSGHLLCWVCLEEADSRFSWITNISLANSRQAEEVAKTGRLRWKIENEGFNTQKNLGYNLQHRYSRTDFNAVKNYYQCLQIAHLIEQLALLEKTIKKLLAGKVGILKIYERIRNMLVYTSINSNPMEKLLERKVQIRFE